MKTAHQKLFEYFANEHNVTLLEGDIAEIQSILEPDLIAAERERIKKYRQLLQAVLRLKTILTYEENIPPEHEGEAIAINNLFYKIEQELKN